MTKPKNPPAFPAANAFGPGEEQRRGMTLRDFFAGQIMPAMIARHGEQDWMKLARMSYEGADAMLAVREKPE